MAEVLTHIERRSLKNEAVIFSAIKSKGQAHLAKAMGVSESLVSDSWMRTLIPLVAKILAVEGCKVVPETVRCYLPETIDPYIQLAKQRMMQIESIQSLTFDDDTDIQLGRG